MPSIRTALGLLGATAAMAAPMKRSVNHPYADRVTRLYDSITGNGSYDSPYFSPERVPYHSIETLMVEAPDHGHESVSETYSYWVWLEAINGKMTGNYDGVSVAWDYMEKHIIPTSKDQPGNSKYNANSPATYAAEYDDIDNYPSKLIFQDGLVGQDPIAKELQQAYGTWDIYIMHWIIDGDNWYGYGKQGDGKTAPAYINTFQRGASESTWKTVPHPSWEAMKWGGPNGFLDLFTVDNSYAKQWRYTAAPDADSRAIQAAYYAYKWAEEDNASVGDLNERAAKLGDYLRYAQYDKYFKKIGNCVGYQQCAAGTGKNSAHYLISWYFAWGGGLQGDWAWRIGSSHTHSGYQNPLTAWVLSTQSAFEPKGKTAVADWETSLERQIELYRWLQSAEGCIAGGATNSWKGAYEQPGRDITSFYGMWYDWQPVYHDPPSNNWTGMQGWGMERLCAMYFESRDERAGLVCRNWMKWVKDTTRVTSSGEIVHATNLAWEGNPDEWKSSNFNKSNLNSQLHGTVSAEGIDLGSIASIIKGLIWGSMADEDQEGIALAVKVINAFENYWDGTGYASEEAREDYSKFGGETYIPSGWSGKNAQGANIRSGVTFIDIRPKYKEDPDWGQVEDFLNGGSAPVFHYHRFWAQTEIAVAQGLVAIYNLDDGGVPPVPGSCSESIKNQGYDCCSSNCQVIYTDADGDWGVENNQWCGCGGGEPAVDECAAAIKSQGYSCCSKNNCDVWYTDNAGLWGVENNEWCGLNLNC